MSLPGFGPPYRADTARLRAISSCTPKGGLFCCTAAICFMSATALSALDRPTKAEPDSDAQLHCVLEMPSNFKALCTDLRWQAAAP